MSSGNSRKMLSQKLKGAANHILNNMSKMKITQELKINALDLL
jgi:hypothetical protein